MALTKITKDMAVIQALPDEPNDVGGLSAAELKAKFDEGGEAVKVAFNNLVDALVASSGGGDIGAVMPDGVTTGSVQAVLDYIHSEIAGTVLGQIPDHSITNAKLVDPPYSREEMISAATKATLGLAGTAVPDDALETLARRDVKHETGSYAGTGSQNSSKTIVFSGTPILVALYNKNLDTPFNSFKAIPWLYGMPVGIRTITSGGPEETNLSWDTNSVTIPAFANISGQTYSYYVLEV